MLRNKPKLMLSARFCVICGGAESFPENANEDVTIGDLQAAVDYPLRSFGVKTGNTDNAGYCQVIGSRRGSTTVYVVVLGAASEGKRDIALEQLLDYGFQRVSPPQPPAAVIPVPTPVWELPPPPAMPPLADSGAW